MRTRLSEVVILRVTLSRVSCLVSRSQAPAWERGPRSSASTHCVFCTSACAGTAIHRGNGSGSRASGVCVPKLELGNEVQRGNELERVVAVLH